jgi:exonuclease III
MVPAGPMFTPAMRPAPLSEGGFRILSWNVAGLRALIKKAPTVLKEVVEAEQPDVVCLQECKLQDAHCSEVEATMLSTLPGDWHVVWNCSQDKKGYSGTAVLSRCLCGEGKGWVDECKHDTHAPLPTHTPPHMHAGRNPCL